MECQWKFLVVGLVLLAGLTPSYQKSSEADRTYFAGVVEFFPAEVGTAEERTENNLAGYREIINSPTATIADIILFPEATLNSIENPTFVPNPKEKVVLCDNHLIYSKILWSISCYARSAEKYIVINIVEKENCTEKSQQEIGDTRPCALDGLNKYNTNVVFDRKGAVISRYRKVHLFQEPGKNTTMKPELATFETDFGVKFGHFTCFDILFYTPTQELVKAGVTDFVYPNMWYSELPFLTAVQNQHAWAYANNVNLLASGASQPSLGSTGTGIYTGKSGAQFTQMSSVKEREIYIRAVPKIGYFEGKSVLPDNVTLEELPAPMMMPRANRVTKLKLLRDKIDNYNTVLLNATDLSVNQTLCYGDLCCNFVVKRAPLRRLDAQYSYKYRLAVYNGVRTYQGIESTWIRTCAIFACTNNSISSCGTIFDEIYDVKNDFIFEAIHIEGEFKKSEKLLLMPNSVDEAFKPVPPKEFAFEIIEKSDGNKIVRYQLIAPRQNLLTFAIYGNYFESTSGVSNLLASKILIILLSLCVMLFKFN